MKRTIDEYEFVQAFDDYMRSSNFSRAGRFALYEFLTDLEEECGVEFNLDVISLCGEFSEYENLQHFRANYGNDYQSMDDVMDMTQVITGYDGERFIAEVF